MDFTRVQAIWETLDGMARNDPDGYKKFIQDQMTGAQDFFGQIKPNSSDPTFLEAKGKGKPSSDGETSKKEAGKMLGLIDQFSKVDILAEETPRDDNSSPQNKLTDDVFNLKSSILSKIVKEEDKLDAADTEDEPVIVNLRLSAEEDKLSSDKGQKEQTKKKPLIELL